MVRVNDVLLNTMDYKTSLSQVLQQMRDFQWKRQKLLHAAKKLTIIYEFMK